MKLQLTKPKAKEQSYTPFVSNLTSHAPTPAKTPLFTGLKYGLQRYPEQADDVAKQQESANDSLPEVQVVELPLNQESLSEASSDADPFFNDHLYGKT
jgi:hypothetical protein